MPNVSPMVTTYPASTSMPASTREAMTLPWPPTPVKITFFVSERSCFFISACNLPFRNGLLRTDRRAYAATRADHFIHHCFLFIPVPGQRRTAEDSCAQTIAATGIAQTQGFIDFNIELFLSFLLRT